MSAELVQSGLVLAAIAVAAVYLGRRAVRAVAGALRARRDPGCGDACGCAPSDGGRRPKAPA